MFSLVTRTPRTTRRSVTRQACLLLLDLTIATHAADIYFTDFDEFDVGPDKWAGTNGWIATSAGLGVHGIDYDMIPGLDNTAFIGGSQPASRFVTVLKPVNIDPATSGTPYVEFESLMGIEDSSNGRWDSFFFTFYNVDGDFLSSIRFSNEFSSFGIWRLDGANQFDTGVDFIHSELHLLFASFSLSQNTWSADLDGIPLFTNATLNATGKALTFGSAAAEWQLASSVTANYGDNWMLVADWDIRAIPTGATPLQVQQSISESPPGSVLLKWPGNDGFDYSVEYSDDLAMWRNDLAGGTISNVSSTGLLSYIDTATNTTRRFYRINRTATP